MIFTIFYTIILSSLSILWTLILIPFLFFGYKFYCITEQNLITIISKNIKYSVITNDQNDPSGFFIGKYYIGYLYKPNKDSEINILYCLCKIGQFNVLKNKKDIIIKETDIFIDIYMRKGNYYHFEYQKRQLNCTNFNDYKFKNQKHILNQVVNYYKKYNNCVTMISGDPGKGKSALGILIAKELNGSLCKSFNPTNPGDNLENLYNQVNPTINNPLILLIDEFDIILDLLHHNKIILHKNIPTEIYNKTTWNNLFDDINLKLYPNLIIILTSNINRKTIEETYDTSYIRKGRINLTFNLI